MFFMSAIHAAVFSGATQVVACWERCGLASQGLRGVKSYGLDSRLPQTLNPEGGDPGG
jgi:hypothetical protein